MNAVRRHLLIMLTAAGLLAPGLPVAGHTCRGDLCPQTLRPAAAAPVADACCEGVDATPSAPHDDGDRCPEDGCKCLCCGAPLLPALVRRTPIPVTDAMRRVPAAMDRSALTPQDAVGALLRPPQA